MPDHRYAAEVLAYAYYISPDLEDLPTVEGAVRVAAARWDDLLGIAGEAHPGACPGAPQPCARCRVEWVLRLVEVAAAQGRSQSMSNATRPPPASDANPV